MMSVGLHWLSEDVLPVPHPKLGGGAGFAVRANKCV